MAGSLFPPAPPHDKPTPLGSGTAGCSHPETSQHSDQTHPESRERCKNHWLAVFAKAGDNAMLGNTTSGCQNWNA